MENKNNILQIRDEASEHETQFNLPCTQQETDDVKQRLHNLEPSEDDFMKYLNFNQPHACSLFQ